MLGCAVAPKYRTPHPPSRSGAPMNANRERARPSGATKADACDSAHTHRREKTFPCQRRTGHQYTTQGGGSSLSFIGPASPLRNGQTAPVASPPKQSSRETRSSSLPKGNRTPAAATSGTSHAQTPDSSAPTEQKSGMRGRDDRLPSGHHRLLPPNPRKIWPDIFGKSRVFSERPRSVQRVRCTARTRIPTRAPAT